MRLTLKKVDYFGDWYIIERAEHDGREWIDDDGGLQCSSRFSDADVEGPVEHMKGIALAIRARGAFSAKRCAVEVACQADGSHRVEFWSPRNSRERGVVTLAEADELASMIEAIR